jgi:hypothetical protein
MATLADIRQSLLLKDKDDLGYSSNIKVYCINSMSISMPNA